MQLTVLAVPGCPNAAVLGDRVAAVMDGRAGIWVSHQVISDQGEAAQWGMHGSPTLLIDGADPFAEPGSRRACPVGCTAMRTASYRVRPRPASSGRRSSKPRPRRPGSATRRGWIRWDALAGAVSRPPNVACEQCIRLCCDHSCTPGLRPACPGWPSPPCRSRCPRCWPS